MNLGFDLDKVFIEYPFFIPDFIINKLYKKQKVNGKLWNLIYRIPSMPEQLLRLLIHYPIFRQPIKENIALVKSMASKRDHNLYLISGRFGFLKNRTNQLIKKYELNKVFKGLYFNFENKQTHLFKNRIINKLKIERYVDDDLPLLNFLAKNNLGTKFFWLNKKINKPLGKNLFAIKNISEMFK